MTTEELVPRELLLALAEHCAFPAVRLGATLLADAGAWRWAAERSTPGERVTLLLLLGDELLRATEGGRAYLAAPPIHHYHQDEEIYYRGDPELLDVVRAAFAFLPDVVRSALRRDTAFLGVGRSSVAWASPAAFVDVAGRAKGHLVVLGPAADIQTVLHECAHAWHAGPPREDACGVSAQGEAGLAALAAKQGWSERLAKWERTAEDLAEGLALCWLLARPRMQPS